MNNMQRNQTEIESQKLVNLALVLILVLSLFMLFSAYVSRGVRHYENTSSVATVLSSFAQLSLEANSAIVYDIVSKKVLFEKNSDVPLPLASVTKIMTAVTAIELLPKNSVITINKEFLKEEGDSGLHSNERFTLSDILNFSLVSSSNDGTAAIAAAAGAVQKVNSKDVLENTNFTEKMNAEAKKIGLTRAVFYNETGLDLPNGINGGYASANDVAKLFEYTLRNHPEIFYATKLNAISVTSLDNIAHTASNTNIGINDLPNLIGSKTGFTDIAGGNLAIIFDAGLGKPVVVVVLGSTALGRFTDVKALAEETLRTLSSSTETPQR